jgi:two-component system sensor histidine kinase/response regulator
MTNNNISNPTLSKILIVDDNPKNLQLLGKVLQEFDLILLDINMPGLDGFEVCSLIRSNPEMNNVPVIFLTASVERESILKGFDLGAQDYITKPFDSRELLVRVRTQLVLKESLEKLEKFNKILEEKVTERTWQLKESNEKLEASNLKLLGLDKAKAGFLNLISHEIRTPLNGMIGPLALLKGPDYASIGNLVKILDISVKRLERFSLDALLITALQTKRIELKQDKIQLSSLVNEVIEEEKELLVPGTIHIKRTTDLTPGVITGDTDLVKKCIVNILNNAVRFSPNDGIIHIGHYADEKTITCEIKDSGKGFASEANDHVFDLFTTDAEYKDNSIGLGLPVAKMIMEFHGGNIIIGNNPEGGAFVKLVFKKEHGS